MCCVAHNLYLSSADVVSQHRLLTEEAPFAFKSSNASYEKQEDQDAKRDKCKHHLETRSTVTQHFHSMCTVAANLRDKSVTVLVDACTINKEHIELCFAYIPEARSGGFLPIQVPSLVCLLCSSSLVIVDSLL
jgi:hypothetical protein